MDPPETALRAVALTLVVGADVGAGATAARTTQAPAVDVLLMHERFAAPILDFAALERAGSAGLLRRAAFALVRRSRQWSVGLAVLAWRRTRHDDVLYVTGEDIAVPLAILLRLSRRPSPKVVVRLEQPTYGRTAPRRALYNALLALALPRISVIACRTSAHAQYLSSVLRVPDDRLLFVGETTDPGFFDPAADGDVPPPGVVLDGRPLVVSAGLEMRDYASLIEAARDLDVQVVIAAGSPWSNEVYQVDGELPANVTVASFSRPQMRWLYRAASLVVVPVKRTLRACGMNVVLEAWAMRRAVVMSRTSGQYDYAEDGVTAALVEPYDTAGLRSTIARLLDDPDAREAMGAAGRAKVVDELNVDRYVDRIGGLLLAALGATSDDASASALRGGGSSAEVPGSLGAGSGGADDPVEALDST